MKFPNKNMYIYGIWVLPGISHITLISKNLVIKNSKSKSGE